LDKYKAFFQKKINFKYQNKFQNNKKPKKIHFEFKKTIKPNLPLNSVDTNNKKENIKYKKRQSKNKISNRIDLSNNKKEKNKNIVITIDNKKKFYKERLIPYVVNAIKNNEELHFTAGDQTRQYVHVSEVPRLLELAYENKLPSGMYNIEGKETMTVKQIVGLIHGAMGKEVPEGCFGSVQRSDVGMKYLALDGKQLEDAIGFEAKTNIIDSITSYII
jgi:dTDP-D-glucose 4,6-dehydratase